MHKNAAAKTLCELIKKQCESLSVHLNKSIGFPPKHVVRFNQNVTFMNVKTRTAYTLTVKSCVYVYDRHWFVSKFCSSPLQKKRKHHHTSRMCFVETVLVTCLLSQKHNLETLVLFVSNSDNQLGKQYPCCSVICQDAMECHMSANLYKCYLKYLSSQLFTLPSLKWPLLFPVCAVPISFMIANLER